MQFYPKTRFLDWVAITLRWLVIIGAIAQLAGYLRLLDVPLLILYGLALWNIIISCLLTLNRTSLLSVWMSILLDTSAALILYLLTGSIEGTLFWIGILPILTVAAYFRVSGGITAGLLLSVLQGAYAWITSTQERILPLVGAVMILDLGAGIGLGILTQRLTRKPSQPEKKSPLTGAKVESNTQQRERERVRTFYELTNALTTTLNYQRVMDIALDLSYSALTTIKDNSAAMLVSAAYLFDEDHLVLGSARRFTPADMRVKLEGKSGILVPALGRGDPSYITSPAKDPELGYIVALRPCNSAACLSLRSGLNVYGILIFGHPDVNFFTDERREVLEMISRQVVISIQNARLYQDLEEEKARMLEIQDDAQRKLARDLHDGPTQSLAAIAMRVNYARRLLERNPQGTAEELYKIEEMARRTTKEIRHMLFTLRPLVLESQGLIPALESMAEKTRETYGQDVVIEADPAVVENLEINKQTIIFFIAEEAVNNARKHAKAGCIWVRLRPAPQDIALLEIIDNGVGFDVSATNAGYEKRSSLGMVNMRERTELVNGAFNIESVPGKGTRIQVFIPLTEEAADRLRRI